MANKKLSTKGSHYLFLTLYAKPDDVLSFCRKQADVSSLDAYAFIEHDKDIKKDGTPVKKHIHLLVHFTNERSTNGVGKSFAQGNYLQEDGNHAVVFFGGPVVDKSSAYSYLTHSNKLDDTLDNSTNDENGFNSKYIYSTDEIIQSENAFTLFNKNPNKKASSDKCTDNSYLILKDMLAENADYLELTKIYGKDFVYHFNNFNAIKKTIQQKPEYDDLLHFNDKLKLRIEVAEEDHQVFLRKYNELLERVQRYEKVFKHLENVTPNIYAEICNLLKIL